jgi:putative transposase
MVDPQHPQLSVARQCALLGLVRSSYYYQPVPLRPFTLQVMNAIDLIYTDDPCFGARRVRKILQREYGYAVGRERVRRLMRKMGLQAIYPRKSLSQPDQQHRVYPYLLRGLTIDRPNQVWCSDVTYVRLREGFVYLVAVMDWYSRYVLSWRVSNTLDAAFCVEALEDALAQALPEIYNTDQGAQFTGTEFTSRVLAAGVRMSMDGRGRFVDNIFIERLWRSLKYEDIYLKDYETVLALIEGLTIWFDRYNTWRPHESLGYETPVQVHGCAA